MSNNTPKYWKVEFFPDAGEKNSPDQYIRGITNKKEKATIWNKLRSLEKIQYPRDWAGVKPFSYDGLNFYQLTVGRHRFFLHLESTTKPKKIIVCYAFPKTSNNTKKIDKNQGVTRIRKYKDQKGS